MKKKLITLLFVFTVINVFAQVTTTSEPEKTNPVAAEVLPLNDMVTNKSIKALAKIPLDLASILIYDYDGNLFSYDLESETIVWTVKATDAHTPMCGNKITLQDGVVYAPFINGEIFAIDNQDGTIFWKSRLGDSKDQIILKDQVPVISNGKLYVTAQNQTIYALNLKDGSLAWKYKLDLVNNDIPVLSFGNKVFTPSGANFYSFDGATGKVLSQKSFEQTMTGKPVTDGENVFAASEKDVLYALSPDKLDVLWQFKLEENQSNIRERIFCKDNKVYFGTQGTTGSSIYAVDSKTGTRIWKTDFKEDSIEYMTEQDDNIWGYTKKGKLFQLDLNGEMLFETKLTTMPISNLEFPEGDSLYYYCDAGLIQYELAEKDENVMYMRTSILDNIYSAYLKIIR
ncbi:outer membrane protein assembly factor BamB family protein [Flavobacterium hydrophilum]|uniref:Pyrrolo-quinoline quinone n=1 Tax=Flavobacterium hydrophilum TaxID=2211445 RepID=A0A2V4BXR3_9FLAO|nr:PQQ-binding-like beta-propeller repeat protein [Flavobacterium hydrophilum]PXY43808.1 pyrrolo-quinoline quinone [Flavobacterium hydrophilum]